MTRVNKKKLAFTTLATAASAVSLALFSQEFHKRDPLHFWMSIVASSLALLGNTIQLVNRYHHFFYKQKELDKGLDILDQPTYNSMEESNAELNT